MTGASANRELIWDWPVRLSHWSFAVLVPAMWYTADNSLWWWHTRLGMALLAVLVFRILWGIIGSQTARFASFVKGPGAIVDYLKGESTVTTGHNPLGALSVIALLTAMCLQVGMGLFSGDPYDGATGPLNGFVGVMTADMITDWHKTFVWVLAALVAVHLAAIAFYAAVKRTNLVGPMITGKRALPVGKGIEPASNRAALITLGIATVLAVWIWFGAPPFG